MAKTTLVVLAALLAAACSSGNDDTDKQNGALDGGGGSGGASGGGGGSGGAAPLTGFSKIHKEIVMPSCTGPLCHSSAAGGNLIMQTADSAYENLINKPAEGVGCGLPDSGSWIRVVPGDPEQSLMYKKLLAPPPCGDTMPVASLLADAQIEEIRAWIADNAPRD